jgi:hypothetical protein
MAGSADAGAVGVGLIRGCEGLGSKCCTGPEAPGTGRLEVCPTG